MDKDEFIQLHKALLQIRNSLVHGGLNPPLSNYEQVGLGPQEKGRSKADHAKAVATLALGLEFAIQEMVEGKRRVPGLRMNEIRAAAGKAFPAVESEEDGHDGEATLPQLNPLDLPQDAEEKLAAGLTAKKSTIDLRVLRLLKEHPRRYSELGSALKVQFPNNVTVALQRLGKAGLIRQSSDIDGDQIVRHYELTPLGELTLEKAETIAAYRTAAKSLNVAPVSITETDLRQHFVRGEVPVKAEALLELVQVAVRVAQA